MKDMKNPYSPPCSAILWPQTQHFPMFFQATTREEVWEASRWGRDVCQPNRGNSLILGHFKHQKWVCCARLFWITRVTSPLRRGDCCDCQLMLKMKVMFFCWHGFFCLEGGLQWSPTFAVAIAAIALRPTFGYPLWILS